VLVALLALMAVKADADGTEVLGPPAISVAGGTGMAVGGVGLIDVPQPQDIAVTVPSGAVVTQVLLYWISEFYDQTGPDNTVLVNGVEVTGDSIGGPTNFFSVVHFEAFRADITGLGLVGPGANAIQIDGLLNSFRTTGAGVLVVYDEGGALPDMQLLDGLDLAYWRLAPPLDTTVPVVFDIEPADYARVASVPVLVGSVGDARPNVTEFIVGGAVTQVINLFTSLDGPEWDSQIIELDVPAGASEISMQLLSEGDGTDANPASLAWLVGGLMIQPPEDEECLPCEGKITQLTLEYLGDVPDALVTVEQKKEGVVFGDIVQPGETFTFNGIDKKDTLGTEISVYVDGELNTKIHTSCSQPIGPGLIKGDFLVVEGYSRINGLLCPVDVPPDTPEDCLPCDGKVTWLTLGYLGSEGATVEVTQKKEGTVFSGEVLPGGEFTVTGVDKKGTLGTEISLYVDGALNTKIHTSCSKPIGPGLVAGDFIVLDGASRNGGLLCPAEGSQDPEDPGTDDDYCGDGKPALLRMVYTGEGCAASNHAQDSKKATCEGDPAGADVVWIVATDKEDPNHDKARIFFEGAVALGEVFDIDGVSAGLTRLRGDMRVFVYDTDGHLLQQVKFHTSCSQPLRAGDQFGSLQLVDFVVEGSAEAVATSDAKGADLAKLEGVTGCYAGGPGGGSRRLGDSMLILAVLGVLGIATRRAGCQGH
jgi:hypothetical protein